MNIKFLVLATVMLTAVVLRLSIDVPANEPSKDLVVEENRVVVLNGEVNEESSGDLIMAIEDLAAISKKPIYLLINSPGGAVFSGAAIITAMETSKAPVNTVCLRICASMAAIIFEHGVTRFMVERSILMFHPASGGAEGEVDKMASRIEFIQRYIGRMDAYIAKRLGLTAKYFKSLTSKELWLSSEDALHMKASDKSVYLTIKTKGFFGGLFSNGE